MNRWIFIILIILSSVVMAESEVPLLPEKLKKEIDENISESSYFPVLKPGDWVGIAHGSVHQTLLGEPDKPELVIGFGMEGNYVESLSKSLKNTRNKKA